MQIAVRFSRLLTLAGAVISLACTDTTSPAAKSESPPAAPTPSAPTTELQTIGEFLVDATDWVLVAVPDETDRSKMRLAIKALADDLVAGRNEKAKSDVVELRSNLSSFESLGPALGPIGVALDQIDSELAKLAE